MSNGTSNITLKHPTGPWWTVYGTPGEIAQQIAQVFPDLAVQSPQDFPGQVAQAQTRWADLIGNTGGPTPAAPQHSPAVQAVVNAVDGTVIESGPTAPAPTQTPAPAANPAPDAFAGDHVTETDKFGRVFEYNHPKAPQTQYGPKVLMRATSQAGKPYAKWLDSRDKRTPANFRAGVRQNPADLFEDEFARNV